MRRTRFNALDGERVCASLRKHRDLWVAVLLDRLGVPNYAESGRLLMAGLIKLRDLPDNFWNADTLFVLTPTRQKAEELARLIEQEDWGGEVYIYDKQDEIDRCSARVVKNMGSCPSGGIEAEAARAPARQSSRVAHQMAARGRKERPHHRPPQRREKPGYRGADTRACCAGGHTPTWEYPTG